MKLSIQLALLSASTIAMTILYQWIVLARIGPGAQTDAFYAGMTVPQLVLAVVSASLTHVLVPLLSGEEPERLRREAWTFLALGLLGFGTGAAVLIALAPGWVPLIVPGFDDAGRALTVRLVRIQLLGMVFTAVNAVQWAAYHARRKFLWVETVPCLAGLASIPLLLWALPRYGIVAAAWVSALSTCVQTMLLVAGLGRPAMPDWHSPALRTAWRRVKPLLAGTTYYKTDPLVDRVMLSMAGSGNLSLYYLGQQIYAAANQLLNRAIIAPLAPALAVCHKAGDRAGYLRLYRRKLLQVGLISGLGMVTLGAIGRAYLIPVFEFGRFTAQDLLTLWWIMVWLAGMFLGSAMGQVSSWSLYASGDTTSPVRFSVITFTMYVPLKVAMFLLWGVPGLAVATGLYFLVNLLLQHRQISKAVGAA